MARTLTPLTGEKNGRYQPVLERFAAKCRFEPTTGCVLWIGGTSAGRGNSARYGRFCGEEGRMHYAHRWAAVHIHGIDLGEHQAGHCCPHGPNTLCVEHVTAQTQLENLAELNDRQKAKAQQSAEEKQHWLFVQIGIRPPPAAIVPEPDAVPFYQPPEWFRPFMPKTENSDDCPF